MRSKSQNNLNYPLDALRCFRVYIQLEVNIWWFPAGFPRVLFLILSKLKLVSTWFRNPTGRFVNRYIQSFHIARRYINYSFGFNVTVTAKILIATFNLFVSFSARTLVTQTVRSDALNLHFVCNLTHFIYIYNSNHTLATFLVTYDQ